MEDDKPPMGKLVKRPTGAGWLFTGILVMSVAVLAVVMIFFDNGTPDPAKAIQNIYIAGTALSVSIGFLAVGSVIRAIWFISGDTAKHLPTD